MQLLISCSGYVPPFRVGVSPWPSYEVIHLANKLGYFNADELTVKELTTSSHVMHSLKSGALDAATLSMNEVIQLLSQGVSLHVVAVLDRSYGGDAIISQQQITQLSQIKGKKIGYESNTFGGLLVDGMLNKAGVAPHQVKLVESKFDEQLSAFRHGELDLIATSDPVKTRVVNQLSGNVLFDSRSFNLPIHRVLVIRTDAETRFNTQIQTLLEGYYRAQEFIQRYPAQAHKLMAARLQLFSQSKGNDFMGTQLKTLAQSKRMLSGDASEIKQETATLALQMKQLGMISTLPPLEECFDGHWIALLTEREVTP